MDVNEVIDMIESMIEDSSVPRNVKKALEEAKLSLKESKDINVAVMKAVYSIEKITDDQNIPSHVRMDLWNVISALESIKTE